MVWYAQADYDVKLEWGPDGLKALKPYSDVIVIVDVLSFSTCVSVATAQGAIVFPFAWKDERAASFAREINAELAGKRDSAARLSLSPNSLRQLKSGERVVLPSPNGSQLSTETGDLPTIAASFWNAQSAALRAAELGRRITIIAAGERWQHSDTLRPALEDHLGAGAIASYLSGRKSPEAEAAETLFRSRKDSLREALRNCASGRELIAKGYTDDVDTSAEFNVTKVVPTLRHGYYSADM